MYPVWILSLPRTVHDSDLHDVPSVGIEVSPENTISGDGPCTDKWQVSHQKTHVEKIVEQPALLDHGVSEDTAQTDTIGIT